MLELWKGQEWTRRYIRWHESACACVQQVVALIPIERFVPNLKRPALTTRPRALQLTAADEITAIENLDILRANGFQVEVDEDKPPGRGERVKLVAMPVSKETVFDYRGEFWRVCVGWHLNRDFRSDS